MRVFGGVLLLCFVTPAALAQVAQIDPQIVTQTNLEGKVAVVEVAARFVTTVRLPEAVNSVVVGDPSQFQVEHSDREPKLVFVKATSTKPTETNLLISMANGHQVSLLLVNRGESRSGDEDRVDFLLRYEPSSGFFVPPSGLPFALVGETVPLAQTQQVSIATTWRPSAFGTGPSLASLTPADPPTTHSDLALGNIQSNSLDKLLEQQESAPLPALYGEHISEESISRDRVRAGVSRVIDGGQQVIVLFSVVNSTKHAILLMPPQVQLGGTTTSGKFIRHKKWSTAEQLPVMDFRLSKRRIGPGERADGVVLFERPPYKQSNETLLLQVAESGAVDRPALAPIGFGISTASEDGNGRGK
jgi:hypothetical protein